jgi:pimeloyl-ACP methyl ester carboxylesterase
MKADNNDFRSGYSAVNGLKMYYEIYGQGNPLVLIHGGGSTIQTSFGRIIPLLAEHRKIIGVELQAHGRTSDRNVDLTFVQDADDVAKLLANLQITKADFLGFSNGGHTTIEIALRHPRLVRKMIIASAIYKRSGASAQFWEGFNHVTLQDMPKVLCDAFLAVHNDTDALLNMFTKDVQRLKAFQGWSDGQMQSIQIPTLIINGNKDIGSLEHAVEMSRMLPKSELAVLPGGHGDYLGALETLSAGRSKNYYVTNLIEEFLDHD